MIIETLEGDFSISKLHTSKGIGLSRKMHFVGITDDEISLVCPTRDTPSGTIEREDGWRGFRIKGTLDFSLTGILSRISALMADDGIGIFAISTYNTDYIFVKDRSFDRSLEILKDNGFKISEYTV